MNIVFSRNLQLDIALFIDDITGCTQLKKQMNDKGFKIVSDHENLRLCVIENCIFIEETMSHILGTILNINWKESKSFGFNSSALSFNQKVHIVMDIKGLNPKELRKLTTLMNIRNKFAHLSEIKTFDDLFTKTKVGKEIKKNFNTWCFDENGVSDIPKQNHEKVYRLCFYLLVHNIVEILFKIIGDHMYDLGLTDGKKEVTARITHEIIKSLEKIEGGKELLYKIFDEVEIDLKK